VPVNYRNGVCTSYISPSVWPFLSIVSGRDGDKKSLDGDVMVVGEAGVLAECRTRGYSGGEYCGGLREDDGIRRILRIRSPRSLSRLHIPSP
jgi:hypothetical protein